MECFKLPIQSIQHIDEIDLANWISLIVTPAFYIGSLQLLKLFETDKKSAPFAGAVVFLFTLFLVINSMRISFYSMYNPRNTLLMYMMGLVIAAVFFTFEYYETLALTLITGLCFAIMIPFYQHEFSGLFLNNMASAILLVVFFCYFAIYRLLSMR